MKEYSPFLDEAERKYGLPKGLLHAQMMQESGGNPKARSPKGAAGLMQFMPATAKEYGVNVDDPAGSIDGAGRYMRDLIKQTGNPRDALAAYNWGIGNLKRKGINNAPKETRDYIDKISLGMKKIAKTGLDAIIPSAQAGEDEFAGFKQVQAPGVDEFAEFKEVSPVNKVKTTAPTPEKPFIDKFNDFNKQALQQVKNGTAGLVRGAGSIGATILAPRDMEDNKVEEFLASNPMTAGGLAAYKLATKDNALDKNNQRRADMDSALTDMGVDTNSSAFNVGKVGGEIAGTAGTGSVLGGMAKSVPTLSKYATALESGGFNLGNAATNSTIKNVLTRVLAGGVGGAAQTAAVGQDPLIGASIGGALPVGAKVAGGVGADIYNKVVNSGTAQKSANMAKDAAIKNAVDAGYVLPPSLAGGGLTARMAEGLSGQAKTKQAAMIENQLVTNNLLKKYFGLSDDVSLDANTFDILHNKFNQPYQDVASLPYSQVGSKTTKSLGTGGSTSTAIVKDGRELLDELKQAQFDKRMHWKHYNRTGDPSAYEKANSYDGKIASLENAIDNIAISNNKPDLVDSLKEARINKAKLYSIEDATNDITGDVNANALAKMLEKGTPFKDEALQAAEFGKAFKDVAGVPKAGYDNPFSVLDYAFGFGGALPTSGASAMLPLARLLARKSVLSKPVQQSMANKDYGTLASKLLPDLNTKSLANDDLVKSLSLLTSRTAPLAYQD